MQRGRTSWSCRELGLACLVGLVTWSRPGGAGLLCQLAHLNLASGGSGQRASHGTALSWAKAGQEGQPPLQAAQVSCSNACRQRMCHTLLPTGTSVLCRESSGDKELLLQREPHGTPSHCSRLCQALTPGPGGGSARPDTPKTPSRVAFSREPQPATIARRQSQHCRLRPRPACSCRAATSPAWAGFLQTWDRRIPPSLCPGLSDMASDASPKPGRESQRRVRGDAGWGAWQSPRPEGAALSAEVDEHQRRSCRPGQWPP